MMVVVSVVAVSRAGASISLPATGEDDRVRELQKLGITLGIASRVASVLPFPVNLIGVALGLAGDTLMLRALERDGGTRDMTVPLSKADADALAKNGICNNQQRCGDQKCPMCTGTHPLSAFFLDVKTGKDWMGNNKSPVYISVNWQVGGVSGGEVFALPKTEFASESHETLLLELPTACSTREIPLGQFTSVALVNGKSTQWEAWTTESVRIGGVDTHDEFWHIAASEGEAILSVEEGHASALTLAPALSKDNVNWRRRALQLSLVGPRWNAPETTNGLLRAIEVDILTGREDGAGAFPKVAAYVGIGWLDGQQNRHALFQLPQRDRNAGKRTVYHGLIPPGPPEIRIDSIQSMILINGMNDLAPAWQVDAVRVYGYDSGGHRWLICDIVDQTRWLDTRTGRGPAMPIPVLGNPVDLGPGRFDSRDTLTWIRGH